MVYFAYLNSRANSFVLWLDRGAAATQLGKQCNPYVECYLLIVLDGYPRMDAEIRQINDELVR